MQVDIYVKYGKSRARDSEGYPTCSLVESKGDMVVRKRFLTVGGGYDLFGTVLGEWVAKRFYDKLNKLTVGFYGLKFHGTDGSRSDIPDESHRVPYIDGAVGDDQVKRIMRAMGIKIERLVDGSNYDIYRVEYDTEQAV